MFRLHEAKRDSHVPYMDITTYEVFSHMLKSLNLSAVMCDVTMSSDSHIHITNNITSMLMVLIRMYVPMYGDQPSFTKGVKGLLS